MSPVLSMVLYSVVNLTAEVERLLAPEPLEEAATPASLPSEFKISLVIASNALRTSSAVDTL